MLPEVVVAMLVWLLDLPLHMQLVPIATDVVSSNLDQGEVYNIMCKRLSVTCGRSVFSLGPPVSSTNKSDHHNITEIFLKVALNTIKIN